MLQVEEVGTALHGITMMMLIMMTDDDDDVEAFTVMWYLRRQRCPTWLMPYYFIVINGHRLLRLTRML